jgi:UTP--glucose-1-phosphate uridylyltransferase
MEILEDEVTKARDGVLATISNALHELAQKKKYLALEMNDYRYNIGVKYGLLNAQLALALSGKDRDEVLAMLMEMLLVREHHAGDEIKE